MSDKMICINQMAANRALPTIDLASSEHYQ